MKKDLQSLREQSERYGKRRFCYFSFLCEAAVSHSHYDAHLWHVVSPLFGNPLHRKSTRPLLSHEIGSSTSACLYYANLVIYDRDKMSILQSYISPARVVISPTFPDVIGNKTALPFLVRTPRDVCNLDVSGIHAHGEWVWDGRKWTRLKRSRAMPGAVNFLGGSGNRGISQEKSIKTDGR